MKVYFPTTYRNNIIQNKWQNTYSGRTAFKQEKSADAVQELQSQNSIANQLAQINKSLQQHTMWTRFGIASMILCTFLLACANRKGNSYKASKMINGPEFKSLKNNSEIPTLQKCKSLNKNLKKNLETQVNIVNAIKNDPQDKDLEIFNRFLLLGHPGNGKSFYAKIFAKTIDAKYMELSYQDVNSRWAGASVEKLVSCFKNIIQEAVSSPNQQYVMVFNEIDAFLVPLDKMVSSGDMGGHVISRIEERSAIINLIDELAEKAPNVTIIGTSNASSADLDKAIISRFGSKILDVPFPDKDCIYEALKVKLGFAGEDFIKQNNSELEDFAEKLCNRSFSFRNLDEVVKISKINYRIDKSQGNSNSFKTEYLKKAEEGILHSDGELAGLK